MPLDIVVTLWTAPSGIDFGINSASSSYIPLSCLSHSSIAQIRMKAGLVLSTMIGMEMVAGALNDRVSSFVHSGNNTMSSILSARRYLKPMWTACHPLWQALYCTVRSIHTVLLTLLHSPVLLLEMWDPIMTEKSTFNNTLHQLRYPRTNTISQLQIGMVCTKCYLFKHHLLG